MLFDIDEMLEKQRSGIMIVTWHVTWSKILKKEIGDESALFG